LRHTCKPDYEMCEATHQLTSANPIDAGCWYLAPAGRAPSRGCGGKAQGQDPEQRGHHEDPGKNLITTDSEKIKYCFA